MCYGCKRDQNRPKESPLSSRISVERAIQMKEVVINAAKETNQGLRKRLLREAT